MTIDPCRDWRGALGAAAIGAIDPVEEIGLRAHLDGCAACRTELRDLEAVAAALSAVPLASVGGEPAEPSGTLGGRVLARVAEERDTTRIRRTRRIATGAAALAAIAALIAAVVIVGAAGNGPSGNRVALAGSPGVHGSAVLRAQPVGTAIDMKFSGLDPHQYYWLWLTDDEHHRMAAGTFTGSEEQSDIRLSAAVPLDEARRIWVTDEKNHIVLDARIPAPA